MIRKITSATDLPNWFKERPYKKQLSKVDWYREIRHRQFLLRMFELQQAIQRMPKSAQEKSNEILLDILEATPRPDSYIFLVPQSDRPVHDLTAGEVLYLRSAIHDDYLIQIGKRFDGLLSLWRKALGENPEGPTPLFREYEHQIASFLRGIEKSPCAEKLDDPIQKILDSMGNPWLSYGRPLNGFPITIDIQYDDQTIISHFKDWLDKKRKAEGERVRRPFNQNDLDGWEHFKIREIFDLEIWARITNAKISDSVIAHVLWPVSPDDFSPIDVLRTTARKKSKEIFTFNVVIRLYGQLLLENGENFLVQ